MFKKTDESEWSRFSKALSGKESGDAGEEDGAAAATEPTPAARAAVASPSAPKSTQDINVTVARQSRPGLADLREDAETLIADKTFFDGSFKAEESIRIRGTVQGEVESQRSVHVEEQAKVTAKVTATTVMVAGQVSGQIYCTGRVEIKPTGRVTGEITAGTLVMQEGAFFEGTLKMAGRSIEDSVGARQ